MTSTLNDLEGSLRHYAFSYVNRAVLYCG